MSVAVNISERRLRIGILKLALALVGLFALAAVGITLLADRGQGIAVNILLVCIAFSFLTNGCFAILKIIEWVDARKRHHG